MNLNLKAVFLSDELGLLECQPRSLCPATEIGWFEAEPLIAAGIVCPLLIVSTEFGHNQCPLVAEQACGLSEERSG